MDATSTQSRLMPRALVASGFAGVAATYFVNPNTTHVPLCPLYAATGLLCPLCGGTRATYALLHGQFTTALHDNALYVVLLPLLLVAIARWYAFWGQSARRVLPRPLLVALVGAAVVFGIVRNLPFAHALVPPT